jgi:hypothetical protein
VTPATVVNLIGGVVAIGVFIVIASIGVYSHYQITVYNTIQYTMMAPNENSIFQGVKIQLQPFQEDHVDLVQLLLEYGADMAAKDGDFGHSPLHWAAIVGKAEASLLLLEHGADVSAKDKAGMTPLCCAALQGHRAVALVLLENGADVSSLDVAGRTALHLASMQGHAELVQLLIEHQANVLAEDNHGATAGDYATTESHLEVVALLKAEVVRRAKCVAFAMGHQERLGAGSAVRWLDPEVLRVVLE